MYNNNIFYAHKDFFKCNVFGKNHFKFTVLIIVKQINLPNSDINKYNINIGWWTVSAENRFLHTNICHWIQIEHIHYIHYNDLFNTCRTVILYNCTHFTTFFQKNYTKFFNLLYYSMPPINLYIHTYILYIVPIVLWITNFQLEYDIFIVHIH